MLTKKQLEEITRIQVKMQDKFRSVPEEGLEVEYSGKKFIVYKNVFWPFEDSKPLVENYRINAEERVLDVSTGSGVIAVFSAYKRARKVVAVDISPVAVRCAKENAKRHGFANVIDVRVSDMFGAIKRGELFDVITGNLPFRNKYSKDLAEATMWDTDLLVHKKFFTGIRKHLKPNGRAYLSQANFGAVSEMRRLAKDSGFKVKLIGKKIMAKSNPKDPRVFYAFELIRYMR